jgi:hypothetical protein
VPSGEQLSITTISSTCDAKSRSTKPIDAASLYAGTTRLFLWCSKPRERQRKFARFKSAIVLTFR